MAAAATMDGMGHQHEPGFLTGSFGKALLKGSLMVAGFAVGGYFSNLLFDPFFFPIIHDPSNEVGQALIGFMADTFGWLHDLIGLTGDGGLIILILCRVILNPITHQRQQILSIHMLVTGRVLPVMPLWMTCCNNSLLIAVVF